MPKRIDPKIAYKKLKEYRKKYYEKNREKILAKNKAWRDGHKTDRTEYFKQWADDNRESRAEYMRKYRKEQKAKAKKKIADEIK